MIRLIPLCLFLLVLPPVEAVQEKPEAAPEVKAYPTLAPGHHVGEIRAMVFTPDGKQLITGGNDKTIQVWDVETGKRVKLFRPPVGPHTAGQINALALAPDGKTLVVAAAPIPTGPKKATNTNYLLNLDDGRIRVLDHSANGAYGHSVGFSPDGKQLALGVGSAVLLYPELVNVWSDPPTELKPRQRLTHRSGVSASSLAFSPSGDRLLITSIATQAAANDYRVRIYDGQTGKATDATFSVGPTFAGVWLLDGNSILTGHGGIDATPLRLWSAAGGPPTREFTPRQILGIDSVKNLEVSEIVHEKDDNYLLMGRYSNTGFVVRFDLKTGQGRILGSVPLDGGLWNLAGAVSPNRRLAALPAEPRAQRIVLIDLEAEKVRSLCGPEVEFQQGGWTTTGNSITWNRAKDGKTLNFGLNLRTMERIDRLREEIIKATTERDGTLLKGVAGGLSVVRGEASVLIPSLGGTAYATLPGGGPVHWVARYQNRVLGLYDPVTGKQIRKFAPDLPLISSLAGSPDGKHLVVVSRGLTRVYNVENPQPLLNVYMEGSDWVAWTEEGYYAASPNGERLIGWTVNQGLNREANLFPAEQFRATLYRPDVIRLLLDKGSVAEALKAANAMRKDVPKGAADPEKLLPPEVSLKVDTSKLPNAVVTVTAKAGCKEQPIKSLRLLVDGRPLPGGVGRTTYDVEKAEAKETWTVEIPPGKHRISVLARSKDDTPAISTAVLVDSPLPANQRPVVHHIAVGISKYGDEKLKLKFAEKDALDLGSAIQKSCTGTLYQKVETTSLTNDRAKRDAVLKALDDTRKVAKSTDLLILSFAGHGIRDDGEFYLLTHEADTTQLAKTAISGADLRAKLADYPCQILLMLDACHSGAFAPLAKFKPATDDAARALADVEMRVAVMCAAQGHEEAFEAKDNGHFTAAVIRALQRDPRAFFDLETGELSVYHLQAFVSQEVSKATDFKQNPYLKMPLAHPPVIVTKFPKP